MGMKTKISRKPMNFTHTYQAQSWLNEKIWPCSTSSVELRIIKLSGVDFSLMSAYMHNITTISRIAGCKSHF
jgi:hypothetical protein